MQSQAQSNWAALGMVREQLISVPPAQREAFYEQTLVQSRAIHIMSDGTLSKLERQPALMWRLTVPKHVDDTLAAEAARVFYSRNEFAISVKMLPSFAASWVGNYYRPSDLVTRLAVVYGPASAPGGGNRELLPALSMPSLRAARLIFRDRPAKGHGANSFLRPSAWAVMELQKRVGLTLQLDRSGSMSEHDDGDARVLDAQLVDITGYIAPLTEEDGWAYESSQTIIAQYKGSSASVDNVLREGGWPFVYADGVSELYARVFVRRWAEAQQMEMLPAGPAAAAAATEDTEMS